MPRRGGILIIGHVVIIELLAQRRGQGRVGGGRLLDVGRRSVRVVTLERELFWALTGAGNPSLSLKTSLDTDVNQEAF